MHCRLEGVINGRKGVGGEEFGIGFALGLGQLALIVRSSHRGTWRRGPGSNWGIQILQTSALPLLFVRSQVLLRPISLNSEIKGRMGELGGLRELRCEVLD